MKLISKDKVNDNFSIPVWLKEKGYTPNFDFARLTTYKDSPVYSLFVLKNEKTTTYTMIVVSGVLYTFEMDTSSRDVVSEFESEIGNILH